MIPFLLALLLLAAALQIYRCWWYLFGRWDAGKKAADAKFEALRGEAIKRAEMENSQDARKQRAETPSAWQNEAVLWWGRG